MRDKESIAMNDKDREPKIHVTAQVDDSVILGDWSVINAGSKIQGAVKIGRAAWINANVIIGGGQSERGSGFRFSRRKEL